MGKYSYTLCRFNSVENVTDNTPAPVLYAMPPGAAPVLYAVPEESPPPYTPPTKVYNFSPQPPGYVTPPEGWKIEGLPTYNEEGRVTLVSINKCDNCLYLSNSFRETIHFGNYRHPLGRVLLFFC